MRFLEYTRVSSKEQQVDTQQSAISRYIQSKNPSAPHIIFSDPDTSTKRVPLCKRKGLQKMLETVKKNDIVLVFKLDRFDRDQVNMIEICREIRKKGANFYSIIEGSPDDWTLGIWGAVAQKERENTSQRTTAGIARKKELGQRYSRHIPYGYGVHPTKIIYIKIGKETVPRLGVIIPIKEEQKAIEKMVELRNLGMSYGYIAKFLTQMGYLNREGKHFQKMTVFRILERIKNAEIQRASHQETEVPMILSGI
jgi:DNA invertase Pin-like site-specific DNA recombinase